MVFNCRKIIEIVLKIFQTIDKKGVYFLLLYVFVLKISYDFKQGIKLLQICAKLTKIIQDSLVLSKYFILLKKHLTCIV